MTPLYHRLVKRLTLPEKSRERLDDSHGLLADLSDVHCFECSAVRSMMDYLTAAGREVHTGERPLVQKRREARAPRTQGPSGWFKTRTPATLS